MKVHILAADSKFFNELKSGNRTFAAFDSVHNFLAGDLIIIRLVDSNSCFMPQNLVFLATFVSGRFFTINFDELVIVALKSLDYLDISNFV